MPDDDPLSPDRRFLLASLLGAAALTIDAGAAEASKLDPSETQITFAKDIHWKPWQDLPDQIGETATLYGDLDSPGAYLVLMKWYPGFMSAPHSYRTDRLSFVVSGTWWVDSGADFDPGATVPVPAGSFVRRVAHTPHYDGVRHGEKQPAVIALFGQGPVDMHLVDPTRPPFRKV